MPRHASAPRFVGEGKIVFADREYPDPGPGQLLLSVEANAICGTDREQYYEGSECVPGHEAAGTVIATGTETSTEVGARGAVFLMDYCGRCRSCQAGHTNQCLAKRNDMGFTADGGYGPFEVVHETNFFPVPDRTCRRRRRPCCWTSWGPEATRWAGSRAYARTSRAFSAPAPGRSGSACWRWPRRASAPTSPSTSAMSRPGVCGSPNRSAASPSTSASRMPDPGAIRHRRRRRLDRKDGGPRLDHRTAGQTRRASLRRSRGGPEPHRLARPDRDRAHRHGQRVLPLRRDGGEPRAAAGQPRATSARSSPTRCRAVRSVRRSTCSWPARPARSSSWVSRHDGPSAGCGGRSRRLGRAARSDLRRPPRHRARGDRGTHA